MSLIIECESPTQVRLLWTTEFPELRKDSWSSRFAFRESQYSFRLSGALGGCYFLYLLDERAVSVPPPRQFDARVCIAGESDEYLSQSKDDPEEWACIWSGRVSDMKERIPDFDETLSTTARFRIVLTTSESGDSLKPKTETEDKMVQTPSSSQTCCPLSADLLKLMDEGFESDLELRCGHQAIPAHRLILSARSEVFRAMLQSSDEKEKSSTGSVDIQDMEFPVLRHFLGYLYAGTLPELTVELARRLYEAGDKYVVKDLAERCARFLVDNLTKQNACDLLALADTHEDHVFKKLVIAFILDQEIPVSVLQKSSTPGNGGAK